MAQPAAADQPCARPGLAALARTPGDGQNDSQRNPISHPHRVAALRVSSNQADRSSARELDAWKETTDQTRSIHFGDLPVLILSAAEPQVEWVQQFHVMHQEMLGLSARAAHRIIPSVEHLNFITQRENAQHVSRAILEFIADATRP